MQRGGTSVNRKTNNAKKKEKKQAGKILPVSNSFKMSNMASVSFSAIVPEDRNKKEDKKEE
uniref:Uncharacterized protein n=1 Tax=Anguilla anguilla TaxID=7936 RepID=A0A0E9VLB7_ANGAN